MHHELDSIAAKAKPPSYGQKARLTESAASPALPVQRPLALQALCCHSGSSPNMASSEAVSPSRRLIFFVRRVFALRPRMGWNRQLPNLLHVPVISCRLPYPGGPLGSLVVSSPNVLAFATL